jgi:hypothetical protein
MQNPSTENKQKKIRLVLEGGKVSVSIPLMLRMKML